LWMLVIERFGVDQQGGVQNDAEPLGARAG
jgi:hypothetical protein